MNDVIVIDEYEYRQSGVSIEISTGILRFHFPPEYTTDRTYKDKTQKIEVTFWQALDYALIHEEIHLVFDKLGEDTDLVDELIVSWAIQFSMGLCDYSYDHYKGDVKDAVD